MRHVAVAAALYVTLSCAAAPAAQPFSMEASALPKGFEGHDCSRIVAAVKKVMRPRSEFETTPAYEARVKDAAAAPLTGALALRDAVAIRVPHDQIELSYDADRAEASLEVQAQAITTAFAMDTKQLLPAVITTRRLVKTRRYLGGNAFGAQAMVTETTYAGCGVAVAGEEVNRMAYIPRLTVKLDPARARALKDDVEAIFIGTPAPPFAATFGNYRSPTIDNPYGSGIEGDAVVLDLKDIWYFSRRTGEIIGRTSAK